MIVISGRRLAAGLASVVAFFVLVFAAIEIAQFGFGHDVILGLPRFFNLDGEGTIPAWYSSVALCLPAILLAIIASAEGRRRAPFTGHWWFLAWVFVLLSIDESVGLHELLVEPMRAAWHFSGILYFAWVIPGAGFVVAIGLMYATFLRALPPRTRNGFVLAGAIYVGGALGMELIGSELSWVGNTQGVLFGLEVLVEEAMEMIGIVAFVYALVDYLAQEHPDLQVRFGR